MQYMQLGTARFLQLRMVVVVIAECELSRQRDSCIIYNIQVMFQYS